MVLQTPIWPRLRAFRCIRGSTTRWTVETCWIIIRIRIPILAVASNFVVGGLCHRNIVGMLRSPLYVRPSKMLILLKMQSNHMQIPVNATSQIIWGISWKVKHTQIWTKPMAPIPQMTMNFFEYIFILRDNNIWYNNWHMDYWLFRILEVHL